MKVYRTSLPLALTLYLPFFALYTVLYLFEHPLLLSFRTVHPVFLLLTLTLLIFPQKHYRCSEKKRLSWPWWFISISGFVGLLSCFFYFSQLFISRVLIIDHYPPQHLTTFFRHWQSDGLFPWAIIVLFALSLQRTYANEKDWGYFSQCMRPIFNSETLNEIGKYCNTTIRYPINISLSVTLMLIGLGGIFLLSHFSGLPIPSGLNLLTMLTSTLLFYTIIHSDWTKIFNWLIKHRCPTLITLVLMIASGCTIFILPTVFLEPFTRSNLHTITYFNPAAWPTFCELVSLFIALSWVPLASATIAIISQGYSTRQIILGTLWVPVVLMASSGVGTPQNASFIVVALIICAIGLLMIFLRPLNINLIWRGLYPTAMIPRTTIPLAYFQSIVMTTMTLIGIYWVSSVYLITLILSAYTISATLMIIFTIGYWTRFLPQQEPLQNVLLD